MNLLKQIFTLQHIIAWFVINLIVLGALGSWVFINVKVLGSDVEISTFDVPSRKR